MIKGVVGERRYDQGVRWLMKVRSRGLLGNEGMVKSVVR